MVQTADSLTRALDHLEAAEPAFAEVMARLGRPGPRIAERGTAALLRTIVGQQVSVAAADSMWGKLAAAYGNPPDLARLAQASDAELRALGQSRQKAGYLRSLAGSSTQANSTSPPCQATTRRPSLTSPASRASAAGRRKFTFSSRRPSGRLPSGDLAVQIELGRLLGEESRPSENWLRTRAAPWAPYRGAAAVLAWHSYNTKVL
jgi:DNA-3-methyladenine glycosylase II